MKKPQYFIGLDISSETFDAAIYQEGKPIIVAKESFKNNLEGFLEFCKWLLSLKINNSNSAICLETTGAYSESICYYLYDKGFLVWSEAPHKVHRAFYRQMVNDKVSAIQIAEYIYRFFDKLVPFEPNQEIIEEINNLLSIREQLTTQKTANKNALSSAKRKYYQSKLANNILTEAIEHLDKAIKEIDKELNNLIKSNSRLAPVATALDSIPGINTLFIANFFVVTKGLQKNCNYKELASYLGICPHEKSSGTSVYRKPKSSGHGHPRLRKLIYLASMCVIQHCPKFQNYFVTKHAQGKNDKLILNNIANKLLKIICAISKSITPYLKSHKSVHPKFLLDSI
jgi:transposase